MTAYSLTVIDSLDALRHHADAWNDLWRRSEASSPTLRAEIVELWIRRFSEEKPFHALVVEAEDDGEKHWVCVLPLYIDRKLKFLRVGMLPSNDWSACGDLLMDPAYDMHEVLAVLLDGLKKIPIDALWLDAIRCETPPWRAFCNMLERLNRKYQLLLRYHTAVVPLSGNRRDIEAAWKKSAIKDIRRRFNKFFLSSSYRFEMIDDPGQIATLLPDCFRLENAGWKGPDGGSILDNDMGSFYLEQARLLAEQGMFRLCVLFYEEKLIAFKYCSYAKNTVRSQKTSFDPSLRDLAPGQMIQWLICDRLIDDPRIDHFDFVGIAGKHQLVWNPELQAVAQCVVPVSFTGKLFFVAYDTIMPFVRRFREKRKSKNLKANERDEASR